MVWNPTPPGMPPGAAGAPSAGVWGSTPPPTGFAGNPLMMAGLLGLAAHLGGGRPGAGMAAGMQLAQQNQQNAWAQQMQALQLQQLQREQAEEQEQKRRLAALGGQIPGMPQGLWPTLPTSIQESFASGWLKSQLPQEQEWHATPDGRLYNRATGEFKQGVAAGGGWTPMALRKEFDAGEFPADVWREAERTGDASVLQNYLLGQGGEPAISDKLFDKYVGQVKPTAESLRIAKAAGNDVTLLEPANPTEAPPSREQLTAFLNTADKRLQPFTKAFRTVRQMRKALEGDSSLTDIMTTYLLIKTFDPDSVVREGEVALVNAAKPITMRLEALAQKERREGFLTPDEKAQVSGLMSDLQGIYEEEYDRVRGVVANRARTQNMPGNILESVQGMSESVPANLWEGTLDPSYWARRQGAPPPPPAPTGPAALSPEQVTTDPQALRLMARYDIDITDPQWKQKLAAAMEVERRQDVLGTMTLGGP